MSGKKHKREIKAQKRAAREAARRAEQRRNQMTALIVVLVMLVGGVLIWLSIDRPGTDLADADELPTPTGTETPADEPSEPGEVVPQDPSATPGEPVDSGLTPAVDDREVACGAEEPDGVDEPRPQYPGGPADVLEDGVDYTATIETSCGTIVLDLLEDEAPATVNAFVFLAEEGFFDGQEIFRNATSIGALQTGSGDNTNTWSIGYTLPGELAVAQRDGYPAGAVAMANSGSPDSGGSQFFFVYNDLFDAAFEANRTYAVFAQVVEGMDVLEEIGAIPTTEEGGETPSQRVYMESVTISADGGPDASEAASPTPSSAESTEPTSEEAATEEGSQ